MSNRYLFKLAAHFENKYEQSLKEILRDSDKAYKKLDKSERWDYLSYRQHVLMILSDLVVMSPVSLQLVGDMSEEKIINGFKNKISAEETAKEIMPY